MEGFSVTKVAISFLISVMAGVAANFISKWLDREDDDD